VNTTECQYANLVRNNIIRVVPLVRTPTFPTLPSPAKYEAHGRKERVRLILGVPGSRVGVR